MAHVGAFGLTGAVESVLLLECPGAWVLKRVPSPRRRIVAAMFMSAASLGVGFLLMWWDPLGVVDWAFD